MNKFITSCALCAALFITPVAVFVFQKTDTLENERRKITAFPDLPEKIRAREIKRFFSGFDAFFADHFPLRDALLSLSVGLHEATGDSLDMDKCYRGKENWLFLGNSYGRCVDKLQGRIVLSSNGLKQQAGCYIKRHEAARKNGAEFVVFIGPNKSSIYPEYLPPVIIPAPNRYISPLVKELQTAGVKVYDPTTRLVENKASGLLYYRTDTHWNARGAYEAYKGFIRLTGLPPLPSFSFVNGPPFRSDLVDMGGYREFPISDGDNYIIHWDVAQTVVQDRGVIKNTHAVSDKTAWVFGDSFAGALQPYIAATFKEARLFKHGEFETAMSSQLPKPDMILWVIVERNFASTD